MPDKDLLDRDIELDEKEFNEFYENFGSKSLKMQGEILKDLGNKKIDIYFKSIGFTTSVTSVIGIIAGLGFTAFGYVQSTFLFFLGEGFLVGAIFYGLIWTQQVYAGEFHSLNSDSKKFRDFFDVRNEKFLALYNRALKDHLINEKKFRELNEVDLESVNLFKTEKEEVPQVYSKVTYFLGICGAVLLFSSFFIFDFLQVLHCIF